MGKTVQVYLHFVLITCVGRGIQKLSSQSKRWLVEIPIAHTENTPHISNNVKSLKLINFKANKISTSKNGIRFNNASSSGLSPIQSTIGTPLS